MHIEPESPRGNKKAISRAMISNQPGKLPRNQIVVNISDSKYPLLEHVCVNMMGWKVIKDDEGDFSCDIIWNDTACNQDILGSLKPYQRLNHFPGIFAIARKNFLAHNLNKMKKRFPEFYDFYPETYCLPSDRNLLVEEFKETKRVTLIVKPEASSQGRGIFLVRRLEDLPLTENFVVQKYISDPLLIDGLKFDMRIYVLVTSISPLTIYMYKEGLARFATEPYQKPTDKNLGDPFKHLTNYAINKFSNKFEFSKDPEKATTGHKRSLESVRQFLDDNFQNSKEVFDGIKRLIIKTICSIQPIMKHIYVSSQPDDFTGTMCFEILGFDVLVTNDFKPLLLEVNHAPSFNSDTPFDFKTKTEMLASAFKIMDVTVERRHNIIATDKRKLAERLVTGKRTKTTMEEKDQLKYNYRDELSNALEERLGMFEPIVPHKDFNEPYEEFMAYAAQIQKDKTGVSNARKRPASKAKPQLVSQKTVPMLKKKPIRVKSQKKLERILDSVNRLYRKANTFNVELNENKPLNTKEPKDRHAKANHVVLKTNIVNLQIPDFLSFK